MKLKNYRKILFIIVIFTLSLSIISCTQQEHSLTDAYTKLYNAVKSKDTEKIKAMMSKSTIAFAEGVSKQQNKPVEEVFSNGFTATTFAEKLPEIRDERIKDNYGKVEVFNQKDNRWEDLAFVKEDGSWKLAVGDLFAGTFQNPGKSQAQLQAENSNTSGLVPYTGNINGNIPSGKPDSNATTANVNTVQVMPENKAAKEEKKK
jgi:lipopolysaccharide export LptBFGC system permease protein LptF